MNFLLQPFLSFSPFTATVRCHPICSHPQCNCAIWLWFLYHVSLCCTLPVNLHWSVSNLQVSWALRDLPCLKVVLHKCAGYIFQLIRCTQDGCRYKSGDGATKHLSQGYFHQCILGLQILVCFTSNFPSLPAQNHTHGRAVLQAEWASIMWSPRCINSSSRRRLSHLITLNQTNVDERWRERGEGGGRWWRGGLEGSARDELTVNV